MSTQPPYPPAPATQPTPVAQRRGIPPLKALTIYQLVVWIVVAAAVIFVVATSSKRTAGYFSDLIAVADSANTLNNSAVSGEVQQNVANGWHTNELLGIIAAQNNTVISLVASLLWIAMIVAVGAAAHLAGSQVAKLVLNRGPRPDPTPGADKGRQTPQRPVAQPKPPAGSPRQAGPLGPQDGRPTNYLT